MVLIQEDTLSEELITEILNWNEETKAGDVWASNHVKWTEVLKYATTGTILSRVFPDALKVKLYRELQSRCKINYLPYSSSALFYVGYSNSCVNWHNDYSDYDAMSIYLNRTYDPNWGGWFSWTSDFNGIEADIKPQHGKFVVPGFNRSVLSTEKEWHCTTPLSPFAQPRISIQLFFSKK
jgi:hypothetical protein